MVPATGTIGRQEKGVKAVETIHKPIVFDGHLH